MRKRQSTKSKQRKHVFERVQSGERTAASARRLPFDPWRRPHICVCVIFFNYKPLKKPEDNECLCVALFVSDCRERLGWLIAITNRVKAHTNIKKIYNRKNKNAVPFTHSEEKCCSRVSEVSFFIHTQTHTVYVYVYSHTHVNTHVYTYIHIYAHTYINTYTHTYIHTHTHT